MYTIEVQTQNKLSKILKVLGELKYYLLVPRQDVQKVVLKIFFQQSINILPSGTVFRPGQEVYASSPHFVTRLLSLSFSLPPFSQALFIN